MKTAKEYFKEEWGTGFFNANLREERGLVQLSVEDVFNTMESYAQYRVNNVLQEAAERIEARCKEYNLGIGANDYVNGIWIGLDYAEQIVKSLRIKDQ